jgi:hypothetical protein
MTDHSDNPYELSAIGAMPVPVSAPVGLRSGSRLRVVLASTALALFGVSMFLPFTSSLLGYYAVYIIFVLLFEHTSVLWVIPFLISSVSLIIVPILMLTILRDRNISALVPSYLILLTVHAIWLAALLVLTVCAIFASFKDSTHPTGQAT